MKIGLLTAPFRGVALEDVVEWAAENGFDAMEVATGPGAHIDPEEVLTDDGQSVKALFRKAGVEISSLAMYRNMTESEPDARKEAIAALKKGIDAAQALNVSVVCTLAGMPLEGKTKMETIEEVGAPVFEELCQYAADRGIKIALENWFATNIQHLDHWARLFELVPSENFGLNFDPSHLLWQGIDYIGAVHEFASRIFHTHAKDTEIQEHKLRRIGNQERGWWRYVIPGFGCVNWGQFIAALRRAGFDGVLSIEHEDGALGREEGFIKGKNYLRLYV